MVKIIPQEMVNKTDHHLGREKKKILRKKK